MLESKLNECQRLGEGLVECEKGVTSLVHACDDVIAKNRDQQALLLPPSQLSGLQSQLMNLKHLVSDYI